MRPRSAVRRPAMLGGGSGHRRHKPDYILVLISMLLLAAGLVVIYAISPALAAQKDIPENYYVTRQMLAVVLGMISFIIAAFVPLKTWKTFLKPLVVAAAVATLIALIMPISPEYPAHRWIRIGGLSFQSVELIKLAVIIGLAGFLSQRVKENQVTDYQKTFKPIMILLGIVGVVVAVLQSDLGSAAVVVAMVVAMGFVAGLPLRRIFMFAGIIAIGALLAISASPYRRDRVATYLNPERDCQAAGYQACQALIAVGSGGLFGKGLAHSGQAYGYLPEAANDSIFAIFAEKFGFFGAAMLLFLFILLFARLKNIMERAPDSYSRFIVVGVLAWLSTQTIINVGAMIGLLPLKGITLPFISYGGTSIIFVSMALGLVFNISRYTTYGVNTENIEGSGHESATYRRGNRRPHYAAVSRRP